LEYFIGSVVTLAAIIGLNLLARRFDRSNEQVVGPSQSYIYSLVGPYMLSNEELKEPKPTQSSKYADKLFIKVVIVEGKAYWIQDSVFYVANYINNEVIKESAEEVDTMSMDKVQLNKIMLVVEKLREGAYDDSWNAGE
jgi:hypothetical protein